MQFLSVKPSLSGKTVISQFLNQALFHFNHSIASQLSHILESFIVVITLGRTFWVKEKIQVLDAVTSIWKRAVILSLISDWCVKIKLSDWPGSAIFSVSEERNENASAWNIRKFHEHNDTCVISTWRNSRKDKISFNPRRLHRDSIVFFEHARSVKKGLSSSTILSWPSAQFVWSTNFRILRGMDHHAVAIYTLGTPSRKTSDKANQGNESPENYCQTIS